MLIYGIKKWSKLNFIERQVKNIFILYYIITTFIFYIKKKQKLYRK